MGAIEAIRNPRPHDAFLTPNTSISLRFGDSFGRADISTTIVGHEKPIDSHSDRTELIHQTLVDNVDPVVLLLGVLPEKLYQQILKALLAKYFRLLCIGNRLPVENTVDDSSLLEIPVTV